MSTPVNPFQDSAAATIWSGQYLTRLRTEAAEETTVPDLMVDLSKLDARIAAFETASIPTSVTNATDDYPFDRARLKREFLDEALALIIRASREANHPTDTSDSGDIRLYAPGALTTATGTAGGAQLNLKGMIESATAASSQPTGGTQVFDNNDTPTPVLPGGAPNPAADGTFYEIYLNDGSRPIYEAYASLIDAAFAAGDKLANQTLAPSQVVTAIVPATVAGVTYNRIATYSDITTKDADRNPRLTQYLVSSDTETEKASGGTGLSGTGAVGTMLKLDAKVTSVLSTAGGVTTFKDDAQGVWAEVTTDAAGNVSVQGSLNGTAYTAATKVSIPLSVAYGLGVTPAPSDGNLPIALDAYRFTGSDGFDYLIGHYDASAGGSDRVFTYKLVGNPAPALTTLATPTTVAGVTYDRIATRSDLTNRDAALNPRQTQYLVAQLPGSSGANTMLKLDAHATTVQSTTTSAGDFLSPGLRTTTVYRDAVQDVAVKVITNAAGAVLSVSGVAGGGVYNQGSHVSIPLSVASGLGITPPPNDANLPLALDAYRFTAANGYDYLVGYHDAGAGGGNRVFTYKLDPAVVDATGLYDRKSLTAPEYLLHWNEARIKVLTGQLNYQKNIITEIQTDLAQANDALAELQKQYAALGTNEADTHYSAATLKLSLFNATHATAGNPFLTWDNPTTRDQMYSKMEWETIRVGLKNYIDRRSSEAQQATLDYQSTLNRYNSAYEIMGKLQEKLDNLVKSQVRNIT